MPPNREPEAQFRFCCPACAAPLTRRGPEAFTCPAEGRTFPRQDGVWRFLLPEREAFLTRFIREYETIRGAEGRGSDDPAYYRNLPWVDRQDRWAADWGIRARSFHAFVRRVLVPLERENRRPLRILDLGAGNGWLSNRLAQRGHYPAAVDLSTSAADGLGAHKFYETRFVPVQAEFETLPFAAGQFDLAVFNASLHYAVDFTAVLAGARAQLGPGGRVVVIDTPLYRDPNSGEQMVRERRVFFQARYGFPSDALPSRNYLAIGELPALGRAAGLAWEIHRPFYGLRWVLRPWLARLRGGREPASFWILAGRPAD